MVEKVKLSILMPAYEVTVNILKKTSLILIIFCISHSRCDAFDTLSALQKYAQEHEESPVGNINWINPDYSSYYEAISHRHTSILRFFASNHEITAHLQAKLTHYLAPLKPSALTPTKIVKINSDSARIFIWGDAHSAFHSVTRCLTFLHEQNIINEQLEITQPDHYFIFNGDAINRSVYNIEMLILLLNLLEKNPGKVFYICGKQEYKGYWKSFTLKDELRIRAKHLSHEQIPLGKEIDAFFATLPLAAYLSNPNHPTNVIRISHFSRIFKSINEQKCGTFFTDTKPGVTYYDLRKKAKSPEYIDVEVFVTAEDRQETELARVGLDLLEQDLGSITWGLFSSPTQVYQKYTNFFYDSFASIQVATPIEKSTISLINRDIRTKDNFTMHEPLNIISGMPAKDPRSYSGKPSILLGSTMPVMQGLPMISKIANQGLMTRINKENREQGGVNGQIIRIIIKNDNYKASMARKNIKQFIERGIDIIFSPIGSKTLFAYLDLVKAGKLIVLFPLSGSPLLYTSEYDGVISYRASYEDEVRALIDYIYTERGARNFTFFYQNDTLGLEPLEAANEVLEQIIAAHNTLAQAAVHKPTKVPYTWGNLNMKKQALSIRESQTDALGLFSLAEPTKELIRQIGIEQIVNKNLFSTSPLSEESFHQYINKHGIPIIFGAAVPNPRISKLEIVEEYRNEMKKNNYTPSTHSLETYITASILIEAFKKIDGPITMESVKKSIKSFKDVDIKGINLTYNPKRADLTKYVYLETGDNDKWVRKEVSREAHQTIPAPQTPQPTPNPNGPEKI